MTTKNQNSTRKLRIGLVVPHIYMHRDILPRVIFSPGKLAIDLCNGLTEIGADVTLFSPGPIDDVPKNITADLSYFETELAGRGDTYTDLLKKHPFTFITLARQAQSELVAQAFAMANNDELDIIHIYTNEEDIALPFAQFCKKPVVFTHHDPFNFLVKYKNVFPKYKNLNWLSMSHAQRAGMPDDTNWVENIYHGMNPDLLQPITNPNGDYVAYLGRIIEQKGVHIAIDAVKQYNQNNGANLKLKIAGKHYAEHAKDTYWQTKILTELGETIEYVGHIEDQTEKNEFLGNAKALLVPSIFPEPFGMVTIESLACGTPVIGLANGATPELIEHGVTGFVVTPDQVVDTIAKIDTIDRATCRNSFEKRFTLTRMCREHLETYVKLSRE